MRLEKISATWLIDLLTNGKQLNLNISVAPPVEEFKPFPQHF